MSFDILQSSTATPLPFLMVLTSDHVTGSTGATCAALLRKNSGAFTTASGAVSEIGFGWYQVAGNASDSGTLGPIILHATASGCDPTDIQVAQVVAYNPQDATKLGLTAISTSGDSMALTSGERTTLATVIGTSSQVESYRANGAGGSLAQIAYELLANITEQNNAGITRVIKKVDHTTTAATYTYDSGQPNTITRAT